MFGTTLLRHSRSLRRLIACCLLIALPVGGLSSVMVQMLGASHFHPLASPLGTIGTMNGWQDFRRAAHLQDATPWVHAHALFDRHHHAPGDATVVALDGANADSPSGNAASSEIAGVGLALRADDGIGPRPPGAVAAPWPRFDAARFKSCDLPRLERPPQA